jgi:hypothetical protein
VGRPNAAAQPEREAKMPWKQRIIGIDEGYERIRDGVDLLTLKPGCVEGVALLTRTTADRRRRVLLLSPRAVELAGDALAESWQPCDAPELFQWDPVVGSAEICRQLGLARPQFSEGRTPTPITPIGRDPRSRPAEASARPSPGPGTTRE